MKLVRYMVMCMLIGGMSYAEDTGSTFTLWQLPHTRSQMNSYVMRTPGNELIVIDGGRRSDAAYLRKFIRERGNHVHAWFISHPHLDHVDALTEILKNPGDMKIDKIYGSLPDDEWLKKHQDAGALKTQRALLAAVKASNHEVLPLSLGQNIKFQGVTFEILGVRNPELTVNAVNNQSAVWRVDVGDTSILFLGDLGVEGGEKLLASSCRDRLKADYVQMAHHGQTGVSEEFYRFVNPRYCLWPTPDWLWDNNKGGQGKNSGPWKTLEVRAWMDKLNVEKHYVAKDGLHQIDIPAGYKSKTLAGTGLMAFGDTISVVPKPATMTLSDGTFTLSQKTRIVTDQNTARLGEYAKELFSPATGLAFPIERVAVEILIAFEGNHISLLLTEDLRDLGEEGYALSVRKDGVTVRARTQAGIFYGIQTLRQLLPPEIEGQEPAGERTSWEIPCVEIKDNPRFPWRGLMMDCSRTFWSKDYIKRTIRLMSLYKLNRLHLHLTDDQGWRLEIRKYPRLTQLGSRFHEKYKEPPERQGYYSQADIKEIIEYGNLHNVTIVPEIEMPGHTLSAIACYPELSCKGGSFEIYPYGKGDNHTKDIFCAGNEKTFQFLEDVLSEVVELFPSSVIHIGGDEVPKDRWRACPKCQKRMKDQGLSTEFELQKYFINRIETFLSERGRILMGWDEILESHATGIGGKGEISYDQAGGALALSKSAVVMGWRGTQGGIAAAKAGHDVVMSPNTLCYLSKDHRRIPIMKAYAFEPVPEQLSKAEARHILGVQACFWSHIDRTESRVDRQLFPRLLSIAEIVWSPQKDEESFRSRVITHLDRLKALGVNYADDDPSLLKKGSVRQKR